MLRQTLKTVEAVDPLVGAELRDMPDRFAAGDAKLQDLARRTKGQRVFEVGEAAGTIEGIRHLRRDDVRRFAGRAPFKLTPQRDIGAAERAVAGEHERLRDAGHDRAEQLAEFRALSRVFRHWKKE
jgi:hypothetical protein